MRHILFWSLVVGCPVLAEEEKHKSYREEIPGTGIGFEMIAIEAGEYQIGSPEDEADRSEDEGPQRKVKIQPFWIGKYEVTWNEYDLWSQNLEIKRRDLKNYLPNDTDKGADAVTRPTKPYRDMSFNMGRDGYPAICMTQLAAKTYCEWLSKKTGHYYRLPTEAEWEYACRAGTTTAYYFGDDPAELDDHAWHAGNSDGKYRKVGLKKPNPWGLYDMHGNVMEWCLDQYDEKTYSALSADKANEMPFLVSTKLYPHIARGGGWDDDPDRCRSATRHFSDPLWKIQDPQLPKSKWYHTDALWLGFRVVRPLVEPNEEEKKRLKGTADDLEDTP